MTVDTLITGGTIATATATFNASIAINNEKITAIGTEANLPNASTVIDATDKIVMPGLVDPHVHIDEVPDVRTGTYETETHAAALGGVTTIIDFAWQGGDRRLADDTATLIDGIENKQQNDQISYVDFGLHGVLSRETDQTLDDIPRAIHKGVTSFKLFMSTYDVGVSNGFVDDAFNHIADNDAVGLVHTEDPSICAYRTNTLKTTGKSDPKHYPDSRPDYAEAMAAEDALQMATNAGANYYGVHTTNKKTLDVIERFQSQYAAIRAETCTHYTVLDKSTHSRLGNRALMAPPLRTPDDQNALFTALDRDILSVVSTDHVAIDPTSKDTVDWWNSPFGVNSLQYSLSVFHDEAIRTRNRPYPYLVRHMCTNPAQLFGLPQKGTLTPGTDADIIIFDPHDTYTITPGTNASSADYSIYEDRTVTGRVTTTLVRGHPVIKNHELATDPGHGQYLERDLPTWTTST